jgi:hypothetical protein
MPRRLFDDAAERYTEEGVQLANELERVMRPVMEKYRDAGASRRDIGHIAWLTADEIMLDFILSIDVRREVPTNEGQRTDSQATADAPRP